MPDYYPAQIQFSASGLHFRVFKLFYTKLNALRGAAAFFVASFHYIEPYGRLNSLFYNSAIFVDLFFVLSGFVIYKGYQRKIRNRIVGAKQFAFLRLMRLYPVHVAIMFAWLLFVGAKILASNLYGLGDPRDDGALVWQFFENLFLINAYGFSGQINWNFPTWSVSAELFAYLVFYIFLSIFRDLNGQRLTFWLPAFLVAAFCYLALYFIGLHQEHPDLVYRHSDFGFLRGAAGFFAGVTLSQVNPGRFVKQRSYFTDSMTELLLVFAVLWFVTISNDSFVLQVATVSMFVVVIGYFSGQSQGLVSQFLNTGIMQHFGRISYSFYLWHVFVLLIVTDIFQFVLGAEMNAKGYVVGDAKWLVIGTAFAITCVISSITYQLIEEPFRRWSKGVAKNSLHPRSGKEALEAA
jgi:peptidoglycan/LPS O-acetylase OafA/YrhL